MKKIIFLLVAAFILSGCATYKFQKGVKPPFDKGYVATYDGDLIPEYTVGKNNSVPADLSLAKERFKRRRLVVEKYYKDMGYIENHVKEVFLDPPVMIAHIIIGIFKLPSIAYSEYKFNNDPKYREKIIKIEEDEYEREKTRIKALKEELNNYIQKDLTRERNVEPAEQKQKEETVTPKEEIKPKLPEAQEVVPENKIETPKVPEKEKATAVEQKEETVTPKEEIKPKLPEAQEVVPKQEIKAVTSGVSTPIAVIIARPTQGFSPLKVDFYGTKSHSPNGKIVSYEWDFGDGDTSNKPKAVNTYWSTTYGTRSFTVTLTVKDAKGATATATQEIDIINK
ncbi:MAG: PKD domain-containing protein [Candidatus Omnitrophota bacterium]